jgi:hypothetical protein
MLARTPHPNHAIVRLTAHICFALLHDLVPPRNSQVDTLT